MSPVVRLNTRTPFHIEPQWFAENGRDLREELHALLCKECRAHYPTPADARVVDRVNPQTGQVQRVDALWECLADHCSQLPDYITPATPLTTAIFRALAANGNQPLSAEELHRRIRKSNPAGILRVLMGAHVENGVVPFEESS